MPDIEHTEEEQGAVRAFSVSMAGPAAVLVSIPESRSHVTVSALFSFLVTSSFVFEFGSVNTLAIPLKGVLLWAGVCKDTGHQV